MEAVRKYWFYMIWLGDNSDNWIRQDQRSTYTFLFLFLASLYSMARLAALAIVAFDDFLLVAFEASAFFLITYSKAFLT